MISNVSDNDRSMADDQLEELTHRSEKVQAVCLN